MRKKGFSLIEIIIGISITTFILSISLSTLNHFIKFYKELKYDEYYSNNFRVIETIENLINSTSVETKSYSLKGSQNIGFKILNTTGVYFNNVNGKSIKNYILSMGLSGDTLYIETPYLQRDNPIFFSNNFHLFRFVTLSSSTGEQTLNYIPGKSPGSKTAPLNYGMEEKILKKIYNGYFIEIKGGVIMEYTTLNDKKVHELFIRRGEL